MFESLKRAKKINKEKEEALKHKFDEVEFDKNDRMAMFIAAFITFALPIIGILAVVYLILWFIFLR